MSKCVFLSIDKCASQILGHQLTHVTVQELSLSIVFERLLAHLAMVTLHHFLLFRLKHLVSQKLYKKRFSITITLIS
jgi:hypothetical protein